MKKEIAIVLGVVVGLAAIGAVIYFAKKRKKGKNDGRVPEETPEEEIPEELQKSISGFDEGETVTVAGVKYILTGGQWQVV